MLYAAVESAKNYMEKYNMLMCITFSVLLNYFHMHHIKINHMFNFTKGVSHKR